MDRWGPFLLNVDHNVVDHSAISRVNLDGLYPSVFRESSRYMGVMIFHGSRHRNLNKRGHPKLDVARSQIPAFGPLSWGRSLFGISLRSPRICPFYKGF